MVLNRANKKNIILLWSLLTLKTVDTKSEIKWWQKHTQKKKIIKKCNSLFLKIFTHYDDFVKLVRPKKQQHQQQHQQNQQSKNE